MKKIEDLNYYELLEVNPLATSQEIHKAYERIRRVYEPNSVALYSLFTPDETSAIHQRIEDAYRTLVYEDNRRRYDAVLRSRNELPEPPPPPPPMPRYQAQQAQPSFSPPTEHRPLSAPEAQLTDTQPVRPAAEPVSAVSQHIGEFTGLAMKVLREQRGITLRNIADLTKVSVRYLEYIEEEHFAKLPARAYIRGFLMLYAKALGCEPERVISDYLKRYEAVMNVPKK